ncbi:MAG TPA: cupin domain-containing protein [Candidatus Obscuribacterales bacterium]
MNSAAVIRELQQLYPGKLIKCLPEDNPSEIVCEFDTKDQHPEWSLAVAVIDRSAPHHHRVMTEIYHVIKGTLTLHVDHEEFVMYEGQQYTITPGQTHWATGDETWVEVHCSPGYTPDDHILD